MVDLFKMTEIFKTKIFFFCINSENYIKHWAAMFKIEKSK
jgi:hypothetical protein